MQHSCRAQVMLVTPRDQQHSGGAPIYVYALVATQDFGAGSVIASVQTATLLVDLRAHLAVDEMNSAPGPPNARWRSDRDRFALVALGNILEGDELSIDFDQCAAIRDDSTIDVGVFRVYKDLTICPSSSPVAPRQVCLALEASPINRGDTVLRILFPNPLASAEGVLGAVRVCDATEIDAPNTRLVASKTTGGGHRVLLVATRNIAPGNEVILGRWQMDGGSVTYNGLRPSSCDPTGVLPMRVVGDDGDHIGIERVQRDQCGAATIGEQQMVTCICRIDQLPISVPISNISNVFPSTRRRVPVGQPVDLDDGTAAAIMAIFQGTGTGNIRYSRRVKCSLATCQRQVCRLLRVDDGCPPRCFFHLPEHMRTRYTCTSPGCERMARRCSPLCADHEGENSAPAVHPLRVRGGIPVGDPIEDMCIGDISLGDMSIGDMSIGDMSIGDISIGDVSIDDISFGDLSIGDISIGDISMGDIAVGDVE